MSRSLIAACFGCWIWTSLAAAGETYSLAPKADLSAATRVEVQLKVGGQIALKEKDKDKATQHPMSVVAQQRYDQQLLSAEGRQVRALRRYDLAQATIKIDQGGQQPQLDAAHGLLLVSREGSRTQFRCEKGHLTREELDLLDVMGNSLLLTDLVPKEPQELGATWQVADVHLATLLGLDQITANATQCALSAVADGEAQMSLAGTVEGLVGGAKSEMEIKARYHVNLAEQRFTWFALAVKEKRAIGPVSPGLDLTAKITMRFQPAEKLSGLSSDQVTALERDPHGAALSYAGPHGKYQLLYDRRWYITDEQDELTVMRMIERGELIAQCNISPLKPTSPDAPSTLEQFQAEIQKSLGKLFGQFLRSKQELVDQRRIFQVVAAGQVSELPINWVYYLLTDLQGKQVTLVFTLQESFLTRFGTADQNLVAGLQLVSPEAETAQRPTPAK